MSAPLRVGILCPARLGGSAIIATELGAGLAQRGHAVHLLATAEPTWRLPPNVDFHAINVPDYPVFEHAPYSLAAAAAIVALHERAPLDILHVHYAVPHAEVAYLVRQMLGATAPRVLTSLHGTDVTHIGNVPAYRSVTRFCVAATDGLVVPSCYLGTLAQQWLAGLTAPAIRILPNFVDSDRFAPPSVRNPARLRAILQRHGIELGEGPVLAHVSTLRPIKRPLDLVEVLQILRRQHNAQLLVVGEGPESPALAAAAGAAGVGTSLHRLGQRDDFAEWLGECDAFVLPSESESFGVAALEALSCGVPVFGYRVGGLPEVVSQECGALVEPFDRVALAAQVDALLRDHSNRRPRSLAARSRVLQQFGRDAAIDRYEACLRALTAERR